MKVLVTGAGGMTGAEIARQSSEKGWDVIALSRSDLDVSDSPAVESVIALEAPDVVFNAAAYTAVDAAEEAVEEAMSINAAGAGNVARAAMLHGARVIHISTDYVFDGSATLPYLPDDSAAPINVYGESKLAGEIAVRDAGSRHVIVRTSWVYSHTGKNFVRTMLKMAEEGRPLRVVKDQHGCPTSSADLAAALICIAEAGQSADVTGTYHFCNAGPTTWFDFAQEVFLLKKLSPQITPIASEEFPTPAKRPRWSVLDCTSFTTAFGMTPRPWQEALADTMEKIS
jgi:dTDP-4-dehydrorhamnose reductase